MATTPQQPEDVKNRNGFTLVSRNSREQPGHVKIGEQIALGWLGLKTVGTRMTTYTDTRGSQQGPIGTVEAGPTPRTRGLPQKAAPRWWNRTDVAPLYVDDVSPEVLHRVSLSQGKGKGCRLSRSQAHEGSHWPLHYTGREAQWRSQGSRHKAGADKVYS